MFDPALHARLLECLKVKMGPRGVSPVPSDKAPARSRKCTPAGTEFFLENSRKNRDEAGRKASSLIKELETSLACNDFQRMPDLLISLNVVREE